MTSDFERLRADLQSEYDQPGAITKAEVKAVLDKYPPPPADEGVYSDVDYDPAHYA